VKKVTIYPQKNAVGIEFTGKGKVTSKQLIEELESAGLKAGELGRRGAKSEP
jgi:hypothetical protein